MSDFEFWMVVILFLLLIVTVFLSAIMLERLQHRVAFLEHLLGRDSRGNLLRR